MPAGPGTDGLAATRWPADQPWSDYPSFRRHVIREHLRLGVEVPGDEVLASEYETRVVELVRFRAREEVGRWNDRHQRRGGGRR